MVDGSTPANTKLGLESLTIQNLRGFSSATVRFDEPVLFLVGPNNAGKTSLLRLIDVLFNWDLSSEAQSLSADLIDELLPARETRNAARRLTIRVRVNDGRRYTSLLCENGVASLRMSLTMNDRRLRLNLGAPHHGETHDSKAESFLDELREAFSFVHIPAGRSADSDAFTDSLRQAITKSLAAALLKPGKGVTKTEKDAKQVVENIDKLAVSAQDYWYSFVDRLPSGWIVDRSADLKIDRPFLAEVIVEQLDLGLTTGLHDVGGVAPAQVGSGLQSLLDLELQRLMADEQGKRVILAVEEPEVFLHPAAQRQLGRRLSGGKDAVQTLVSTHSPLILEEASFEQVAIIRDHTVSQAQPMEDERAEINTALVAGRGAEVLFARSVLLVEGPGDREYWEAVRRRLAVHDPSGSVDHCYVLEVGSNTRMAPWIRLFQSYPTQPIRWLAVLDFDSVDKARTAAKHARLKLSERQRDLLKVIKTAVATDDLPTVEEAARRTAELVAKEPRILLAPGDLEALMCSQMSEKTAFDVCDALGLEHLWASDLSERLGTKHRVGGRAAGRKKMQPWMGGVIGRVTPATELDTFTLGVLHLWVAAVTDSDSAAKVVSDFVSSG